MRNGLGCRRSGTDGTWVQRDVLRDRGLPGQVRLPDQDAIASAVGQRIRDRQSFNVARLSGPTRSSATRIRTDRIEATTGRCDGNRGRALFLPWRSVEQGSRSTRAPGWLPVGGHESSRGQLSPQRSIQARTNRYPSRHDKLGVRSYLPWRGSTPAQGCATALQYCQANAGDVAV